MAIQMRRGNEADFNASLLMPGEFAVSQDQKKVRICFRAGVVIELATSERLSEILEEMEEAIDSLDQVASNCQTYANQSQSYAVGTDGEVRQGDATDNSKYYKEQAETTYQNIQNVIDEITPAFTLDFNTGHLSYAI